MTMANFEDFYRDLTSDERWHEAASRHHKPETFQKVSEQVYTLGLSDRENFEIQPLREHRNHVVNKLNKILPDKVLKPWYEQKKKEEVKEEIPPVSWEKRAEYLNQIQQILKGSTMMNNFPRLTAQEQIEKGDWKAQPFEARSEVAKAMVLAEHVEKIREARRRLFLQHFPKAKAEEVNAYLKKFETSDIEI